MIAPAREPLIATPLVEELVPCPDPWDIARKLAHLPHLLFLDSAVRHDERARYSYVMAEPVRWIAVHPDLWCRSEPIDEFRGEVRRPSGPYDSLDLIAAQLEWQETLNKARGLLKAIEIAEQRAGDRC